jgi:DNA repair exonuclease SbcCD nuclease subunit
MSKIVIISDAHLLMQAEWVEDEGNIIEEGKEVLDNFNKCLHQIEKDNPTEIVLAGDMFDYRTKGGQRVAHREGEKYMLKIGESLKQISEHLGCNFYALKGNHDSEPVLKRLEKELINKFFYAGNKSIKIDNLNVFLLNSNYTQGYYEIPLQEIPKTGDLLIMHESAPLWEIQGVSKESFVELSKRFKLVLNGHMHIFLPSALGLSNVYMLPALIPSREIKGNWILRYKYPNSTEPEERETPFGYIVIDDEKIKFRPYKPLQITTRVEIRGEKPEEFLEGITTIYDTLIKRNDKEHLRVWIETNADPITIDKIFRSRIAEYPEIKTIDIIRIREMKPYVTEALPRMEFGDKAFTLEELIGKCLGELKGTQRDITKELFDTLFTKENLLSRRIDEPLLFKMFLDIMTKHYKVSEAFLQRIWELAKER